MNVVYSASDLYAPLAGISITSLFENNKEQKFIDVYILDNGIGNDNKCKLIELGKKYGRGISFFSLPESLLNSKINIQRWNVSTFGRLFEASSLPDTVEKVIHIDCDTIIDGSLAGLWDIDMSKKMVAGAVDCLSDAYKSMIGLDKTEHYINAGNIVINLKRIRETRTEEKFLMYIHEHAQMLTYVDQEVLNAVIPENEKYIFPLRNNSYSILHYFSYQELCKVRNLNGFCSVEEYEEAKCSPVIIHYTTCFMEGTRPWVEGDTHPFKYRFEYYKKISPWKDMKMWKDTRTWIKRCLTKMIHIMPKKITYPIIGYAHGTYIPNRNIRLFEKSIKTRRIGDEHGPF